jgi:hypothetical protein
VANKTSKQKPKVVEIFQEKGIIYATEIFLYFLICAEFCPKKRLVSK